MADRMAEGMAEGKPERIETELKLGLPGAEAWQRVRDQLDPSAVLEQTNHFFDAPDGRMALARIAVRLRSERSDTLPARCLLTVKGGGHEESEAGYRIDAEQGAEAFLTRRPEFEALLSESAFETILTDGIRLEPFIASWRRQEGDGRWARFLDDLETQIAGALLTRRFGFQNRRETVMLVLRDHIGPIEVELEIDRSTFPSGRVDHEIEVERSSEGGGAMTRTHRALVDWLDTEIGVVPFPVASKLARLEEDIARALPAPRGTE